MKKTICLLLSGLLAAALAGCGPKTMENRFTSLNEIATYNRIDPERTQLIVSRTGNIDVSGICQGFEKENPDVQVIIQDITGGNTEVRPAVDWVKNGYAPDVMITAGRFFLDEDLITYFENLSTRPIIQRYEAQALNRAAVEANIYWLPGPSDISAMTYNKTLFERYGWQVPKTVDQFIGLCGRIREDTAGEVEPWNPNAKYSDELLIALEAFAYEELFGGADNRAWYNDFTQGKAAFAGHMEPYYNLLETLAEEGVLREEHFSYSATTRGKEFAAGKIAMINGAAQTVNGGEYEFGYFPFPTTKGTLGYINDNFSYLVGIPKRERTKAESDAVGRFIEFISTPEGQRLFIGKSLKMSSVKGASLGKTGELAALQPAADAGHMFAMLNFNALGVNLHQDAKDIVTGVKTGAECIAAVDARPSAAADEAGGAPPTVLAVADRNFTALETSFYIADAYREAVGADIGLINHGVAFRGNLMRIFQGELTPAFVTVLKPRSFENDAKLCLFSMTGGQLIDALNHPKGNDGESDSVYAFSGLQCKIAPWNPQGEKYLSVKTADGAPIDAKKVYTVAAWDGTIAEEYISKTLKTYEGSFEELMTARMKADKTLVPAADGRVTLVWD